MKKYVRLAIALGLLSSCLATEDTFKIVKQGIDTKLEELAKFLSTEQIVTAHPEGLAALKNNIASALSLKIGDDKLFLSEQILADALKALVFTVSDTCIQPGSGNTPLLERLQALQKTLVIYTALHFEFLKKLETLTQDRALMCELHVDYLRALAKQGLLLRTIIDGLLTSENKHN